MIINFTYEQIFELASKMFDNVHVNEIRENTKFCKLKDRNNFVQREWLNAACDAINGYNIIARNVDFSGLSMVKNCCLTCRHVDLYRPACKLRGDDIDLLCVCSKFELFEFEILDEDE